MNKDGHDPTAPESIGLFKLDTFRPLTLFHRLENRRVGPTKGLDWTDITLRPASLTDQSPKIHNRGVPGMNISRWSDALNEGLELPLISWSSHSEKYPANHASNICVRSEERRVG